MGFSLVFFVCKFIVFVGKVGDLVFIVFIGV